jgi:hypothetical protein
MEESSFRETPVYDIILPELTSHLAYSGARTLEARGGGGQIGTCTFGCPP